MSTLITLSDRWLDYAKRRHAGKRSQRTVTVSTVACLPSV